MSLQLQSAFKSGSVLHCRQQRLSGTLPQCTISARRIQRFLSQPFHVAENFTGIPGKYVPLEETLRGFEIILGGECDDLPEQSFLMCGTIDEVLARRKAQ